MRSSAPFPAKQRRRGKAPESGDSYLTEYAPPRISAEVAELTAEGITGDIASGLEGAMRRVRDSGAPFGHAVHLRRAGVSALLHAAPAPAG